MKCPNCGAEGNGKFCEYCGCELPRNAPDTILNNQTNSTVINNYYSAPQQTPTPNQTVSRPYIQAPAVSGKNQTVALVLCIFLGFFGAHYFYVGKAKIGILYLLTMGLFGIGWLVDIFRIATGSFKDSSGLCLKKAVSSSHTPTTYSSSTTVTSARTMDLNKPYDNMDGHEFEYFCGDLLKKNEFSNVEVTRGSGDQGIDIIAYKDGVKYGIQCKCYSQNIGNKAVQEAFAGKTFYDCHVAAVLTNQYFTRSAKELAEHNGVLLWDRNKLEEFIRKSSTI